MALTLRIPDPSDADRVVAALHAAADRETDPDLERWYREAADEIGDQLESLPAARRTETTRP